MTLGRLGAIGVFMELCYLSFYVVSDGPGNVLLFIGTGIVAFLLFACVVYQLRTSRRLIASGNQLLAIIIGFAALFRLTLVPHSPVASDDVYRYVWDGKVAASGINPFVFAPNDPRLSHLHTTDLPAKINFPDMRTIYPPLAQVFFFVSHQLFGDSISGLKALLVLADLLSVLLLVLLLHRLDMLREAVILYAWSPLPILYFALDGHIDALGIPFLILCLLLAHKHRYVAAAVSLGVGALVKLYPLIVAPFLLKGRDGRWKPWAPLIPVLMLALGCWFYLEPTGGLYESLAMFAHRWEFNGSMFELLYFIARSNDVAHLVSGILFLCWLGWVFVVKRSLVEKVFLAFLGFVIFGPVVHPWYLCWLAAILVVRWSLPVFVLLGFSSVSNIVVYVHRASGTWQDQPVVLLIEYLPFYVLLVREIAQRTFSPVQQQLPLR